uniref:Uncharacterized protein n=1 Tax=Anguilla anguilla TaxID=7936 RepID=A0A0E9SLR5_ANGAN
MESFLIKCNTNMKEKTSLAIVGTSRETDLYIHRAIQIRDLAEKKAKTA